MPTYSPLHPAARAGALPKVKGNDQQKPANIAQEMGVLTIRPSNIPIPQHPRAQGAKDAHGVGQFLTKLPTKAPEMPQKRTVAPQPGPSKPPAQPGKQLPRLAIPEWTEADDAAFLPLEPRKGPASDVTVCAASPPAAPRDDEPFHMKALRESEEHEARKANLPKWYEQKGVVVAKEPGEIIRIGSRTYTIIATLQAPPRDVEESMSLGVFKVRDSEKKSFVAKHLSLYIDHQAIRAKAEVEALMQIKDAVRQHENINMLREVFFPERSRGQGFCATMILEWCDGGTLAAGINELQKIRSSISEDLALHLFYSLSKALVMMHHGMSDHTNPNTKIRGWDTICHLDIKPANVLLDHNQFPGRSSRFPRVVLADFGCAVSQADIMAGKEGRVVQNNGTPGWFPPEGPNVAAGNAIGRYGKPTDVWQAAGTIQCMCTLLVKPNMKILKQPCGPRYSNELNCLVSTCLSQDYRRRPTAIDLANELRRIMVQRKLPV